MRTASEFGDTGIQTWTSVDVAAMNMASKPVCFSWANGTDGGLGQGFLRRKAEVLNLNCLMKLSRNSQFRKLSENASRAGRRLIIEVHDQNPVTTIGIMADALEPAKIKNCLL